MKKSPFSRSSRRTFVRNAGLGLAACALHQITLRAFASAGALGWNGGPRALVVIHLQGGHDSFNTFVPFQDDRYYQQRPTLALHRRELIPLAETVALNRAGQPLEALFKDGKMAVVFNVGPDRASDSHYRSSEIWHTASAADQVLYSGWAGRCVSHLQAGAHSVRGFHASASVPRIFIREEDRATRMLTTPGATAFSQPLATHDPIGALAEIAERVGASDATEIYFVSVSGFDTHASQAESYNARMQTVATALQSLQQRLEQRGVSDRVLTMAFSEFGRSLGENSQAGTDHGGASPVFILGDSVRGGFYNQPSLSAQDVAGAIAPMDHRRVIRTLTHDWLRVPVASVFERDPGAINLLSKPLFA
jgi:uncharacterized protein (DUF1501 family)